MKKKLMYILLAIIVSINIVAYNHAYHFSHFNSNQSKGKSKLRESSFASKLQLLFTGISNPKPINHISPERKFETIKIKTHHDYTLDTWYLSEVNPKGTVILFHGYTGKKSDLLREADVFNQLGYNTVLVDFYGSGDSDGNETTIGYYEALDVVNVYNYIKEREKHPVVLYGPSMGAVAITKAVALHQINPTAIILECPYGSLVKTVKNRFELMSVPSFGFAELLVFWGGIQNGYWGFSMNTIELAKKVDVPTLVMHGENDKRAKIKEVKAIYNNVKGEKRWKVFKGAAHESYSKKFPISWKNEIHLFLSSHFSESKNQ